MGKETALMYKRFYNIVLHASLVASNKHYKCARTSQKMNVGLGHRKSRRQGVPKIV